MNGAVLSEVLQCIRGIAAGRAPSATADTALLERFVRDRDPAAFELILARHGPMVWGVCSKLIFDMHVAEDAFQATFLVLVRKANSIRRGELLGHWLYGVAHRVAGRARKQLLRRHAIDRQGVDMLPSRSDDAAMTQDTVALIHEELNRLPDKYRAPLVLCCLQGMSQEDAARELGGTPGSVRGYLERGRRRLRDRLNRRGLAIPAALLTTTMTQQALTATVPADLMRTTQTSAASLLATGAVSTLTPAVAILMKGTLQAMMLTKIRIVTGVILTLTIITAGAGQAFRQNDAGAQTPASDRPKVVIGSNDDAIKQREKLIRRYVSGANVAGEPPQMSDVADEQTKRLLAALIRKTRSTLLSKNNSTPRASRRTHGGGGIWPDEKHSTFLWERRSVSCKLNWS